MGVDLDDPGVGGDLQHREPRVGRRRVAFDDHRRIELGRGVLDPSQQIDVVVGVGEGREEHVEPPVARLHHQSGAYHPVGRLPGRRGPVAGARNRCGRPDPAARQDVPRRQRRSGRERILLDHGRRMTRIDPGERVQRQAQAGRRVAGDEQQMFAAQQPETALPHPGAGRRSGQRQHIADRTTQVLLEHAPEPLAVLGSLQPRVARGQVHRELPFPAQVGEGVFVGRHDVVGAGAHPVRQRPDQPFRVRRTVTVVVREVGEQCAVPPQRLAVRAPVAAERPARQRFAGVALALAVVQHAARTERRLQAPQKLFGQPAFGGTEGVVVPLGALHVVDRHEGRLAPHREPHVVVGQGPVDRPPQPVDGRPRGLRIGPGDPRRLAQAGHRHRMDELDLRLRHAPADGRGRRRLRRRGHRQVTLGREHARGRVEAHPSRARQIDLGPGVEVGEVAERTGGAVEGFDVGNELNQVARDEPGGQSHLP